MVSRQCVPARSPRTEGSDMTQPPLKPPRKYVNRDMNWLGAIIGLGLLAVLAVDFAVLGSHAAGYLGAAAVVVISAVILRATAHRRARSTRRHG
jgi:hypothetical protein